MSINEFYKDLFEKEHSFIDSIIFDDIHLLSKWKKHSKNELYYSVGLINDVIYTMFYEEKDGYLLTPAEVDLNDDFGYIIRYSNIRDDEFYYSIYERLNDIIKETTYLVKKNEDNLVLEHDIKEYDVSDIEIFDALDLYNSSFLNKDNCISNYSIKMIKALGKVIYIKKDYDGTIIEEEYDGVGSSYLTLFEMINSLKREDNQLELTR